MQQCLFAYLRKSKGGKRINNGGDSSPFGSGSVGHPRKLARRKIYLKKSFWLCWKNYNYCHQKTDLVRLKNYLIYLHSRRRRHQTHLIQCLIWPTWSLNYPNHQLFCDCGIDLWLQWMWWNTYLVPEEKKDKLGKENKSMALGVSKLPMNMIMEVLLLIFLSYSVAYSSSAFESTMHTNNWAVLVCTSRFWYINLSYS